MMFMPPSGRRPHIRTAAWAAINQRVAVSIRNLGADIAKNCVDCHMQVQDSDVIVSNVAGKQVKMRIRNHWIKVYAAPAGNLPAPQNLR